MDQSCSAINQKNEPCSCLVCCLLRKEFSSHTPIKKSEIINEGRPTPPLPNLITKIKVCTRHFHVETYEECKWLTGCPTRSRLFCWPCLLFANESGPFTKRGFSDLNNLHKVMKRHDLSATHLQAVIKEKMFGKSRIEHIIDNQLKMGHRVHNELVEKNRGVLRRLIDVVCYLGEHEQLTFRGYNQSDGGNFMDLISLLSKYDKDLKSHLDKSSVIRGTSNRIQNDIICAIAIVVLDRIKSEINQARFVAIVLDETSDVDVGQPAALVRYVKPGGKIQERFLGFLDVVGDRTADSLYEAICQIIKDIECCDKLVAQSYDGAVVKAGHLGDLQAKVKETFPSALFVHCFGHRLNSVLTQSVTHIKECKVFFATISGIADFFTKSPKRTQALDSAIENGSTKLASTWKDRGKLAPTVYEYRESLIELFESISENEMGDWDMGTINSATSYLYRLKNDFNFNFLLRVFSDTLLDVLQTESNDFGLSSKKVEEFKIILNNKKYDFDRIWEDVMERDLEPQRKRLRTDDGEEYKLSSSYRYLLHDIIDQIHDQINHRFSHFESLKFFKLCDFCNFKQGQFSENALNSLVQHYGNCFDAIRLRSELGVIYTTEDINSKENASELLKLLKETGLNEAFKEVSKLCELVLTIPSTSALVEPNFSILERIRSFARNSTREGRLSKLSFLTVEKELVKEMSEHPRFYNDVIEEFAKKEKRIELHYM